MQFTITPSQMREEIIETISVGLVPYFKSAPGIGKSATMHDVAKMGNLMPIDVRLSQYAPEDLNGLPRVTGSKAQFVPFDTFPIESDPLPEGYDGWLILFDEISSAHKQVQVAAYKIVFDKMVGNHKLHPKVAMVCAGNRICDKAVAVQMSTALRSRLIHYTVESDLKDFMGYAISVGIDHRILGYLNYLPSKLMNFNPDLDEETFACPRTWEFLSLLIKDREITSKMGPRIAGTIGSGTAIEFMTFVKEYSRIPQIHTIIADPDKAIVPTELSTKYATLSMLIECHTEKNIEPITKYIQKFHVEMQIIFAKGVLARSPKLRDISEPFSDYILSIVQHLK